MPIERKREKRTSGPLERTLGMGGNEEYVLPPLTYASFKERMGDDTCKWT